MSKIKHALEQGLMTMSEQDVQQDYENRQREILSEIRQYILDHEEDNYLEFCEENGLNVGQPQNHIYSLALRLEVLL